ncbi:MAG TPA: SDR family oxidoreductase [Thermoleophilaceae bacterium]
MSWSLQGRTVLITGAARGIGAESARRVAARGANVALVGLEPEELERVATQCGSNAAWFEADVTDTEALERAVAGTVERFGGLDVVMANAGIAPAGLVRSMDPAAFERTIEINLLGAWRTVRAALPHVIERRGYVLVVASVAAVAHAPGLAAYAASKAGVEAFSDSLRSEVAHLGVDVGVGSFHWIDTDMVRGADAHPAMAGFRQQTPGPLGKTYSVASVGKAVADGMEQRRRWVVVPGWVRGLLALRGVIGPLIDRSARDAVPEAEAAFERDIAERGVEAVSAPVGVGGQADPKLGQQPVGSTEPQPTS